MGTSAKPTERKLQPGTFAVLEKWVREGVPPRQLKAISFAYDKRGIGAVSNERQTRFIYYFNLATKAFGDAKLAEKFMTRKHPKLGASPVQKLDTEWGGREVEQILNSIMYGLPA